MYSTELLSEHPYPYVFSQTLKITYDLRDMTLPAWACSTRSSAKRFSSLVLTSTHLPNEMVDVDDGSTAASSSSSATASSSSAASSFASSPCSAAASSSSSK